MKPIAALALAAALAASTSARADEDQARSPDDAAILSIGTTLAGWVLIASAMKAYAPTGAHSFEHDRATWLLATSGAVLSIVGPSAGHIYAGEGGHAARFSAARFGALAVGVVLGFGSELCSSGCGTAAGVGLLGFAGYAALTIYDWSDAPDAARRYDRAHGDVQIVPLMMRDASSHASLGVGIVGTF